VSNIMESTIDVSHRQNGGVGHFVKKGSGLDDA
jgi:hypothetical protein